MSGTIDLNSVIAMMNQAESASTNGTSSFQQRPAINTNWKSLARQEEDLHKEVNPETGKGKQEWDAAQELNKKVSQNMQPVDPNSQVAVMQTLDADQQNYALVAFNILNSRSMG